MRLTPRQHIRLGIIIALVIMWGISLALPALAMIFDPANGPIVLSGSQVLTSGAFAIAAFQFGWIANPLLFIALILLSIDRPPRWPARVVAALLALCALNSFDLMLRPEFHGFVSTFAGFYLWLAAYLLGAAAILYHSSSSRMA